MKLNQRPIMNSLPCELTAKERDERAAEAANLLYKHDSKEQDLKDHSKAIKGELERLMCAHRHLSNVVRTNLEQRDVECDEVLDKVSGTVSVVRRDTGEVVSSREATSQDLQAKMQLD